jgi:hypothetical protein
MWMIYYIAGKLQKKVGGNKKTDGKTVVSQASFFLLF